MMENLEYKVGDKLVHNKGYTTKLCLGSIVEVMSIKQSYGTVTVMNDDGEMVKFLIEDMDRFFSNHHDMKLFHVEGVAIRHGTICELFVCKTKEEAERKFLIAFGKWFRFSDVNVKEIKEIDGYTLILKEYKSSFKIVDMEDIDIYE